MSESAAAKSRKDTIVSFVEGMHIYFFRRKDISIHALFDVNCDASSGTAVMTRDNHSLHSRPHIIPFCQMSREPRKHVILAIESKKVIVVQRGKISRSVPPLEPLCFCVKPSNLKIPYTCF